MRILILDANENDAALIGHVVDTTFLGAELRFSDSKQSFLDELNAEVSLVLAEYALPDYNAISALHEMRIRGLDIPLIVVTGTLGDEAAANCIKLGATDYLRKDYLDRLPVIIKKTMERHALHMERVREVYDLRKRVADCEAELNKHA